MSWRERPYSHEDGPGFGGEGPDYRGARSWAFAGMPAPGPTVKALLIANICVFILCLVTGGSLSPIFQLCSLKVAPVVYQFQIWRLWTYSYIHSQDDLLHIVFNMIALYFLGSPLEQRWGSKKLFLFYTVGSVLACALYVPLAMMGTLSMFKPLVGASGGIMAILGACAVMMPHMKLILVFFSVPIRFATVLFILLFTWNAFKAQRGGDACHLAGLAFGIYFGYRGQKWFALMDNWGTRRAQARWETQRQGAVRLEQDVDRILEKVRRDGIQSLTRREKQTLETATKSKQQSGHARHL